MKQGQTVYERKSLDELDNGSNQTKMTGINCPKF